MSEGRYRPEDTLAHCFPIHAGNGPLLELHAHAEAGSAVRPVNGMGEEDLESQNELRGVERGLLWAKLHLFWVEGA